MLGVFSVIYSCKCQFKCMKFLSKLNVISVKLNSFAN